MPDESTLNGPVALQPILVERIWGSASLLPWHSGAIPERRIGEVWLTAETCVVEAGEGAGKTLAQLTTSAPRAFGDPDRHGFPLLIKLLFPREKLSVQVHPDDAQAQAQGMPRGKTECWYILQAEPGAEVAVGFREPLNATQVAASIEDGSLESRLRMIPVQAGDMVFVDAGTVHAIGPGMVVLETQQYSDTTYRLWDYGRPRELHIQAGTAVTRTDTRAGLVTAQPLDGYMRLVSCGYFAVDRFALRHGADAPLGEVNHLQIVIALSGGCALLDEDGVAFPLPFGQAVVVPVEGVSFSLVCENPTAEVIRVLQPKP